mgnify:CR=1 FL=1|tara:strand:+ start:4176 stop:5279 length:1104 start_codon:yes stop_codon:yes gene_type:complete
MVDALHTARDRANAVRFAGENVTPTPLPVDRPEQTSLRPLRRAMDVTAGVTPILHQVVAAVCENLAVPMQVVRARVYASEEMQAHCSLLGQGCLIEISSSLVEHLDPQEQAFVIGHEVGHFLLDHHFVGLPHDQTIERYKIMRARELSADRLGLIATRNAEAAMRAVMKTFSGLSERHLRFDAASFLRDAFNTENANELSVSQWDTHPSFAVRARCLVHFMPLVGMALDARWLEDFKKIDLRVQKDVEKFSEGGVADQLNSLLESVKEWVWVAAAVAPGKISGSSMSILEADLRADFVEKIRTNFSQMTASEVDDLVNLNLAAATREFVSAGSANAIGTLEELCTASEQKFMLDLNSTKARRIYRQF